MTQQVTDLELATFKLAHGSHKSLAEGACIMEPRRRADGFFAKGTPASVRLFGRTVRTPGGCWEFTGSRSRLGYGNIRFKKRMVKAHRVAWELTHGDPEELCVLHRCDNPPCVNPDHLFLGTVTDNNRDRANKGRSRGTFARGRSDHPATLRAGENHWQAKLSDVDVLTMRQMREGGALLADIARTFDVNPATASRICRGVWR